MIKRLASLVLAIAMLLQILVPQTLIAKEEFKAPSDNLVKVGLISGDSYDSKLMLELNRLTAKNRKRRSADPGTSLFGYFGEGNEPKNEDKPKYYGEVKAKLEVKGIDGGNFPWNDIFGSEEVHLRFIQINEQKKTATGVERVLNITSAGEHKWTDGAGNPAELPLFNNKLEPLKYEVKLDEEVSDKVKLLTARITSTNDATSPTFEEPDSEGRIKYHLTLELTLQQVASTKFKSEWHTDVEEAQRPQVQATFTGKDQGVDVDPVVVDLPKNDKDDNVIRDWEDSFEEHLVSADYLYETPTVGLNTTTQGLTFDAANKTVKSGDYKFKYTFTYDVINGGKLTMTELIPVTFDANGGKFDSITDQNAEQKIVKEVEYDKDLNEKVEIPRRDSHGFKGWGVKNAQGDIVAVTSDAFKNVTKATTFYAMWKRNKVSANELEVKESYREGTTYVNDFIPTLEDIKAQVKIKDSNGVLQPLKPTDTVEVLDDNKQVIAQADLKDKLYEKLKEDDSTEISRDVQINVRVTRNNVKYPVTVKIKVYKNIYEAKTEEGRPVYVPTGYVKVTVDPTTKAEKPQKYFYYVNPEAKVAIEKENPVGVGTNTFVKWANGTTEYKLDKASNKRYQFKNPTVITAEYTTDVIEQTDPNNKLDTVPENFVKVTFKPTNNATDTADKIYWVNPSKEVTFPIADPVGAGTKTFKEWKLGNDVYKPSTPKMFTDTNGTTITATYVDDVLPADASGNKPAETPADYVKVTVKLTDMASVKDAQGAELTGEDYKKAITKIFWVNPKKKVKLPVTKPVGKDVPVDANNPKEYKWKFTEWKSNENGPRTWKENVVADGIEDKFPVETIITAQYEKVELDQGSVTADEVVAYESYKDGSTWVNNFLPKEADLNKALKVKGNALPNDATVTFLLDKNSSGTQYASLEAELYDKLQEKDNANMEPIRVEKVKAKVKFANGEVQNVEIPIKVYKNIYEAKTLTEKPHYVPDGYVKVTVDPTTKAKDPQKTYYYVNKDAKVVIPGTDPVGTDGNKFVKWTYDDNGTEKEYKLADKPRHQFSGETTITAQYVSDVIPQEGDTKPDYVPDNFKKVTFDPTKNGTLEGAKIFWVNPDKAVTIPVKDAAGKDGFTFKEWKNGNAVYDPNTAQTFASDTTITASYDESGTVIPYDPNSPITKPDGYIRVKYVAEHGLTLSNIKYYYVKKNAKDPNGNDLTLASLTKPSVSADNGYAFDKWEPADTQTIGIDDITVTAKARKLGTVIPEIDDQGRPNKKPAGYVDIEFVVKAGDETKGSIDGVKKYYVNPNEYVKFDPPTTTANTGYEFGSWDKDVRIPTVYKTNTTVTGSFNEVGDVKTDPNQKGANDVTITFKLEKLNNVDAGTFDPNATTEYYVTPNKDVSLNPPKVNVQTGYKFLGWDFDTTTKKTYSANKTVTGKFEKIDEIVDGDQAKPDGYVTVTFVKGENGKSITGQTVYYVNPKAGKTIGDLAKPTVKADVGYIQKGPTSNPVWKPVDTTEITRDITVEPEYEVLNDVVPKFNADGTENAKPERYIEVTFNKGDHGKELKGNTVVYINPNKAASLKDFAPKVEPNTGYDFADWDTQIAKKIQYSEGDIIKALYNKKGTVIPQTKPDGSDKPDGYFTVTFDKGEHGELRGKTVYYVNPNEQVTVPAPTVKPNVGYEFNEWDQALTQKFTENKTIKAQYTPKADIIAQTKADGSDKPDGYYTVTFNAVNGSLTNTSVYYVNGEKELDLTATANAINKKGDVGYTADGGTWNTTITSKKYTSDETYTFTFKALDDAIKEQTGVDKPDGYKKVTLKPTANAKNATDIVYYVNPTKEVTITNKPEGKTETKDGVEYTYTFRGWTVTRGVINSWSDENIKGKFTQDTEITAIYSKEAKTKEPPKYDPKDVIPFDPSDLDDPSKTFIRPSKDYIKITFKAEPGLKLTESKAYYVKKNAKAKDDPTKALTVEAFDKPKYINAEGYQFDGWENGNAVIAEDDIIVTAKAKKIYSECTPDTRPDYRPDYETRYKYRDRIIEKEKIVEKIVKVGSDDLLKEIRYMQGFNGKFRPYDGLTRAEAAQILANALKADGYRYNEHYALGYTDVGNEWYTDAIRVVTQAGVFTGYNDGSFKPQGKITRAEWVSTLRRFQNLRVEAGNLMNLRAGHWASGEVGAALKAGWLDIYVNGIASFDADAPITRQEVAAVSNKAFRRVLDKVYLRRSVNTLLNYKDINPSMPLYEDILCASNTLLTDGRYYKANTIVMDNVTFNIVTDLLKITQKKFQILH